MAARHEQIGQRAGDEQTMSVLLQPALAHLGKAEHPLADPDHMLDPSPHFGLGAVFRRLDLIDSTAGAVAAACEFSHRGLMLSGHRPVAAVGWVTPYAGLSSM